MNDNDTDVRKITTEALKRGAASITTPESALRDQPAAASPTPAGAPMLPPIPPWWPTLMRNLRDNYEDKQGHAIILPSHDGTYVLSFIYVQEMRTSNGKGTRRQAMFDERRAMGFANLDDQTLKQMLTEGFGRAPTMWNGEPIPAEAPAAT